MIKQNTPDGRVQPEQTGRAITGAHGPFSFLPAPLGSGPGGSRTPASAGALVLRRVGSKARRGHPVAPLPSESPKARVSKATNVQRGLPRVGFSQALEPGARPSGNRRVAPPGSDGALALCWLEGAVAVVSVAQSVSAFGC